MWKIQLNTTIHTIMNNFFFSSNLVQLTEDVYHAFGDQLRYKRLEFFDEAWFAVSFIKSVL